MNAEAIGKILGGNFDAIAVDGTRALKELGLAEGASVLDVGTGKGNFAIFLAAQGYRVLTGEPSNDASRYARQDWEANAEKVGVRDRIRFENFDASQMPFEAESFDAVFFFGVLHHIEERDRAAVLREALRVAKANAPVVLFEPNQQMLERLWVDDPAHPPAAQPGEYLTDKSVREERVKGKFMVIYVYGKAATH